MKWNEVQSDPRFQSAPDAIKQKIADDFFSKVILPDIQGDVDVDAVRAEFNQRAFKSAPVESKPEPKSFTKALFGDTKQATNLAASGGDTSNQFKPEPTVAENLAEFGSGLSAIERRGVPVTAEYFEEAKAEYEQSTPERRQAVLAENTPKAKVFKRMEELYAKVDDVDRATDPRIEKRTERLESEGLAPETARNIAQQGGDEKSIGFVSEGIADREVVDYAKDTYLSAAKILPTTGKMVLDVGQLGAGFIPVVGDLLKAGSDGLGEIIQDITKEQSPQLQAKAAIMADIAENGTAAELIALLKNNPDLLSDVAIPSAGSMLLAAGPAAVAGKAQKLRTYNQLSSKYAGRSQEAMRRIAERAGAKTATSTAIASNAALNAGSAFDETDGPLSSKYTAALIAATASLGAGKLTEGGAEGFIARGLGKGKAAGLAAVPLKEGLQEYIEEGGTALGTQVGEVMAGNREEVDIGQVNRQGIIGSAAGIVLGAGVAGTGAMVSGGGKHDDDEALIRQRVEQFNSALKRIREEEAKSTQALDAIEQAGSVDEAIALASEATNTPVIPLDEIASQAATMPSEAIDLTDVLGEQNVSDQNVTADMVAEANESQPDQPAGSAPDNVLPAGSGTVYEGGIDSATAPEQSDGTDIPAGNVSADQNQTVTGLAERIAQLEAEIDKADKANDLMGMSKSITAIKSLIVEDTAQAIEQGDMPVFKTGKESFVTIAPSAQNEGMIQVTRYNNAGIFGDSQYNSIEDAIRQEGIKSARLQQSEAQSLMASAINAEAEYQASQQDTRQGIRNDTQKDTLTYTRQAERAEFRPIVESIAKRRAAANEIGRLNAFDRVMDAGRRLMAGEEVKVGQLKVDVGQLKKDSQLYEAGQKLIEMASAPEKEAKSQGKAAEQFYADRIASATSAEQLQTIATEIAKDGALTDAQVERLDDSLMNAMDMIDSPAAELAGTPIDNEWTAFAESSGTLGIPRNEMPQIKAEHRGAMVNFLNARGISHQSEVLPAADLKPTQKEFSPEKVQKAKDYEGGDRSILISSDNHVLDGHHQWMAKLQTNEGIEAIRLNAPISQLIAEVREFPSAEVADGAKAAAKESAEDKKAENRRKASERMKKRQAQNRRVDTAKDNMLVAMAKVGGFKKGLKTEGDIQASMGIEGNLRVNIGGGFAWLFTKDGYTVSQMAEAMWEYGYITQPEESLLEETIDETRGENFSFEYNPEYAETAEQLTQPVKENEAESTQGFDQLDQESQIAVEQVIADENWHILLEEVAADDEVLMAISARVQQRAAEFEQDLGDYYAAIERENEADAGQADTGAAREGDGSSQQNSGQPRQEDVRSTGQVESQQESVTPNADLLGDNTAARQAIADAERAKDEARNARESDSTDFVLTGSNRPADVATARGAQDLFGFTPQDKNNIANKTEDLRKQLIDVENEIIGMAGFAPGFIEDAMKSRKVPADMKSKRNQIRAELADVRKQANQDQSTDANPDKQSAIPAPEQSELEKAKEALDAAGVTGTDRLTTIAQVRRGELTANDVAEAHGQKIEDFGEKMAGARKDIEAAARKEFSDEQLATEPLSKIWPVSDINAIEDPYVAAWSFASRAEIPSKPKKSYKLAQWVAKVKALRMINQMALDGRLSKEKIQEAQKNFPALNPIEAKVRLLEQLPRDQWKRIESVNEWPNAYGYAADRQTKIPSPQVFVRIDGENKKFKGSSVEEVMDSVNEALGQAAPKKRMEFQVRGNGSKFHIYKKGDSNYHKLAGPFDDPKKAFAYIEDSYTDLVAAWDGVKDRENIKKTDVRGTDNKPRTGQNWREGKNVTPENFAEQFGFRGIEFGNWVNQGQGAKDRQGLLNQAYDALMDLASIIGVPPKAISLNGSLGLAFGSRGKGNASAHFEPDNLVINLTKTKGAGTLAHEWFHALDNYFSRMRGGEVKVTQGLNAQDAYRQANYITYKPEPLYIHKTSPSKPMTLANLQRYRELSKGSKYYAQENWMIDPNHPEGVRPEVEAAFADVVNALDASPMNARALGADKGKEGYWSRIIERAARSFENYVIHKMRLNGYDNDYLANVATPENFPRSAEIYPYLLEDEIQPVADAFDGLFSTVQTKETDKGVAMFSRAAPLSDRIAAVIAQEDGTKGKPLTVQQSNPASLQMLGFEDRPVVIRTGNDGIMKMHYEHGLSADEISEAIETGLNQPAMLLQHKGQADVESVWLVTNKQHNGMPIVLAIQPDSMGATGRNHLIATALAIDPRVLASKIKNGDLLYRDTRIEQPDVVKIAVQTAQKKYAQSPRSLLGVIPNSAPLRGRAYKILSQSNLVNNKPAFSFGAGFGMTVNATRQVVNQVRSKWENAPQVIVVSDMADEQIPQEVIEENNRQLSRGASGQPEGFYYNGKVYVIASEMSSPADVVRVMFHETLGHFGLRNVFGKDLEKVLKEVATLRRKEIAAKGREYGLVDNPSGTDAEVWKAMSESDRMIAAEEVLAEMAQTKPEISFVKRAIAAIKQFFRNLMPDVFGDMALTDADIISNYILPARQFVEGGEGGFATNINLANSPLSRSENNDDFEFVRQFLNELAFEDDAFRHGISQSQTLEGNIFDAFPSVEYLGEDTRADEREESGAERRFVFAMPQRDQRLFYVYERDNKVWIDVSRLLPGDQGSAIYHGVANYAYNTGKVFVGDPMGLSEDAIVRRTSNMLSSALRFGTTKHLDASPEQVKGIKEKGIEPLNWRGGDIEKTRALIYTFSKTLENQFPGIKEFRYDFGRNEFVDSRGRSVDADRLERGARTSAARASRAGEASLRRGILIRSLASSKGSEKPGLLENVLNWSSQLVSSKNRLQGLFSRQQSDIRFSRKAPQQQRLMPSWDAPEASKFDTVLYALQDKNIDLRRVKQAIERTGKEIQDRWNAYLQEELFHGRSAKRTQDFISQELTPLIDDMRERGVEMANFEEFLWARHAPERNAQIAKINPDMPDGGSGMTTQEANDYMAALPAEQRESYEALAKRIDAINAGTRQLLIDYGIEDATTIAAWNAAYKNYVPLMREDMDNGFGNGTGQGYSIKGTSSKRATGSNRAVVDILANIAQQREKAIIRGEKNRVSTALIGMAHLNPNPDFWRVNEIPLIKMVNERTNQVEERPDPNYKNRDNVIVARIVGKDGKVKEHALVMNEFDDRAMRMAAALKNLDMDRLDVVPGFFAPITRYFSAINTQYNPVFGLINIIRDVQGAVLNLESTPLKGMQRQVLAKTGPALVGIYKEMRARRQNQTLDNEWSLLWEEFQQQGGKTGYRDMYKNAQARSENMENALNPELWQKKWWGKVLTAGGALSAPEQWLVSKPGKAMFNWLSDYNDTLENSVRLAAYKQALDNGISKQQAASIAKNLTVNFNRKGAYGRDLGAFYAFYNASVQGTARIAETIFEKKPDGGFKMTKAGKAIVYGGLLLGVMQQLALVAAGYDDDEPPEFVRDRNFIIPLDFFGVDKKYITIPMPLGYNAIPATGRILTEWALDGFSETPERIAHLMEVYMDMFNPIGYSGLSYQTISPTALDPFVALGENKDWTGQPIAKQDFNSLDPTPGFTRAKDSASTIARGLSYALNAMSGGTEFTPGVFSPTPDQIDYLMGQISGGVGREYLKLEQTATSVVTGDSLPTYKIPIVGRFYGDARSQGAQGGMFYNNLMRMNKHKRELNGLVEKGGDIDAYYEKHPEAQLSQYADRVYRTVQKMRQHKRLMQKEGAGRNDIVQIESEITALMAEFNAEVRTINGKE